MIKFFIFFLLSIVTQIGFSQVENFTYSIKNLKVNTKYSDFGPAFFGPNRLVFASSKLNKKLNHSKKNINFNNRRETPKYDLFKGFIDLDGEINYDKKILNNYTTKYNESNVSFSPDLKQVYFTQNNVKQGKYIKDKSNWINLKIYRADISTNGEWKNIISLPFNNDNYSCGHPSLSEDGRILFFTSDMPGGFGKSDIYWVTINANGTFGEPQNLGAHVNSTARENFPYVDGNILYFSSDRNNSLGGLDIYNIAMDEINSEPHNLGSNINSPYDDFGFIINREKKIGYFSSNRPEGKGEDDIYFFSQKIKEPECIQHVSGIIYDDNTKLPLEKATIAIFSHDFIMISSYQVDDNGKYSFNLACRDNYSLKAIKNGYIKTEKDIFFHKNQLDQKIDLYLKPIKKPIEEKIAITNDTKPEKPIKEKEIPVEKEVSLFKYNHVGNEILNLKPIYFDLDEYYITEESFDEITKAFRILRDNPQIIIEVDSHTDCRASDSYNLHLSTLRAKEVVKHLIKMGIPAYRLKAKGFGETQLVNHCRDGVHCTEAEHLQNRRTEFLIIKK